MPGIGLPLQDSNLVYLIQSGGPRALNADNLTGSGVPTSISALSVNAQTFDAACAGEP